MDKLIAVLTTISLFVFLLSLVIAMSVQKKNIRRISIVISIVSIMIFIGGFTFEYYKI
ncbi:MULTISPECIES: hypothetical protein [Bacillus cereus group]|uniref:hypothetical protein n=1 Tax=Bacillus cereus group TaxID=86661 RepID=UPI0002F477AB|nr:MULTISPECIES: hypothetical protein [Bacillus cereus group]MBJ7998195.1 hypothetical protein [Bacillus cereus]MBJ8009852.1 hypothetical protein [Bacillus cereus]MBJ8190779.1 hypothetical protein [Bacillus cereus]QWI98241.1 hypothetical protein J5V73_28040 [Bacillus mycoides]